jgi:site-specific recombinase XerD
MENKQEIINMAFQERQKLENYKELVRGSLSKLQDRKEESHHLFVNKENEENLIFQELTTNINELESIKREERRIEALTQVVENERKSSASSIEDLINRLKEFKRYLLLEGLTEDA